MNNASRTANKIHEAYVEAAYKSNRLADYTDSLAEKVHHHIDAAKHYRNAAITAPDAKTTARHEANASMHDRHAATLLGLIKNGRKTVNMKEAA